MKKAAIILGIAIIALAAIAGWQIGACYLANVELRSDMKDLASEAGTRIGLNPPSTDEDFRNIVAGKAKEHGIVLKPEQVTVQRTGPPTTEFIYLATEYEQRVSMIGYSFELHFSAASPQK